MKTHTNVNRKLHIGFGVQTSVQAGACSVFPANEDIAKALKNGDQCTINTDGSIGCCSTKPTCKTQSDGSVTCVLG